MSRVAQAHIREQVWLIVFDGEYDVGVAREQVIGELALGEQSVGGKGLLGDDQGLDDRDHRPDFFGLLGFVADLDGQSTDFFWV